jgi:CBS-domain-containing membrane protein
MSIADISRQDVLSIDSGATVADAAVLMREHHVGALVVTAADGDGERAIGMLTDRDLAVEVLGRRLAYEGLTAGDVASRTLVSVRGEADLAEAISTMNRHGVRRLLVTGQHGEVTGIVSLDDVLESLVAQLAGLAMTMRNGMAREATQRQARIGQRRPVFLPYGTPGMPGA